MRLFNKGHTGEFVILSEVKDLKNLLTRKATGMNILDSSLRSE